MNTTLPLTEVRNNFPKLVENVSTTMDRVIISKNGKPRAVMLSVDEYESIVDTIEILSSPLKMARLRRAQKQAKEGKGKTIEEVAKELDIRL